MHVECVCSFLGASGLHRHGRGPRSSRVWKAKTTHTLMAMGVGQKSRTSKRRYREPLRDAQLDCKGATLDGQEVKEMPPNATDSKEEINADSKAEKDPNPRE